jgi:hypothetical protein
MQSINQTEPTGGSSEGRTICTVPAQLTSNWFYGQSETN